MSDEEIQDALKRAAALVEASGVPTDLRTAAFQQAMDLLTGGGPRRSAGQLTKKMPKGNPTKKGASMADGAKPSARRGKGPKSLIKQQVEKGTLADWVSLSDVQELLRVAGHKYEQPALSPALLALTREEILEREEQTVDGKTAWAYRTPKGK